MTDEKRFNLSIFVSLLIILILFFSYSESTDVQLISLNDNNNDIIDINNTDNISANIINEYNSKYREDEYNYEDD